MTKFAAEKLRSFKKLLESEVTNFDKLIDLVLMEFKRFLSQNMIHVAGKEEKDRKQWMYVLPALPSGWVIDGRSANKFLHITDVEKKSSPLLRTFFFYHIHFEVKESEQMQ